MTERYRHVLAIIGEPNNRMRINSFGYRTVKKTGLWGNIPMPLMHVDSPKTNPKGVTFGNGPRDPSVRAQMPLQFSEAILAAVTSTATRTDREGATK